MTPDPEPAALVPAGPDLAAVDTATLRAELARALRLTADHLLHLARVWAELERRGEDLSALRVGLGAYLPKIAAGVLLPEVVVRFAGEARLLARVAALPVGGQQAVLDGGPVPAPPRPAGGKRPAEPKAVRGADPVALAKVAGPRDLADTISRMIEASPDPADVARRILPTVERHAGRARR